MKSSIAQRLSKLGVGLESADLLAVPEETPVVDATTTDVVDTLALTDVQSEVDEAESVLDRLQEDHGELSEVAAALESFLASADPISPMVAAALAIPARRATKAYGLSNSIPSVESFGTSQEAIRTNLRASLEATDSRLEQLGTWIKDVFKSLLEKITALWEQLTDRFGALKKKAQAALELVKSSSEEKSGNITVPTALARRLYVEGEMPKDFRQPMKRLTALVGGQLNEISDELMQAHEENLKDAEQLVEDVKNKLPGFAQSNLDEYTEKTKARIPEVFARTERARAEAWITTEGVDEVTKSKPLMGNEQLELVAGIFGIKGTVQINGDFPSEPVEIARIAPDVCEELLNSVIEICDIVAKYNSSMNNRKELYKKTEKVAWNIVFKQHTAIFNQQFIREFALGLMGFVQSAKALAGPTSAHAFRSCSAIVSVCELSAKA